MRAHVLVVVAADRAQRPVYGFTRKMQQHGRVCKIAAMCDVRVPASAREFSLCALSVVGYTRSLYMFAAPISTPLADLQVVPS